MSPFILERLPIFDYMRFPVGFDYTGCFYLGLFTETKSSGMTTILTRPLQLADCLFSLAFQTVIDPTHPDRTHLISHNLT